jgi:hypothetical protein
MVARSDSIAVAAVLLATAPVRAENTNQQWIGPFTSTADAIRFRPSCDAQGQNCKKCLGLSGGSTANGTPIDIWDCLSNTNQKWVYDSDTSAIQYNANTSKCIGLGGDGGGANGNILVIADCGSGSARDSQRWKGGGFYQVKLLHSYV